MCVPCLCACEHMRVCGCAWGRGQRWVCVCMHGPLVSFEGRERSEDEHGSWVMHTHAAGEGEERHAEAGGRRTRASLCLAPQRMRKRGGGMHPVSLLQQASWQPGPGSSIPLPPHLPRPSTSTLNLAHSCLVSSQAPPPTPPIPRRRRLLPPKHLARPAPAVPPPPASAPAWTPPRPCGTRRSGAATCRARSSPAAPPPGR